MREYLKLNEYYVETSQCLGAPSCASIVKQNIETGNKRQFIFSF